ncbi:hypothetical protein K466DRAFT_607387 [Polyporus arcularius HHB13444]|uniref:Uncharacterized protein n=1 Tax=Polyporus arcularius HHB13444 TaxID=1314778 RepID=A0A5C3NMY7_9APHY|nr:hypothetical protein K466DRAFT_607387 [Polyporus arcularius HHB13444]
MPSIVTILTQPTSGDESPLPQKLPLLLPSAACIEVIVPPVLLEHEWRLRQAQAYDALTDLRGHLEVRAYVYRYKDQNLRGQREILRSRDVVNGIEGKIKLDAARYRAAYSALTTLSGALSKLDWRGSLQPLLDSDIRHVAAGDGSGSESRRELSWIWKAGSVTSADGNLLDGQTENLQEGLRVEWCKARARASRWTEEVEVVEEEMRRTRHYLEWQSKWWRAYVPLTPQQRDDLHEGANAYAHRQASIRQKMAAYCERAWRFVGAWVCMGQAMSGLDSDQPASGEPRTTEPSTSADIDVDGDVPSLLTVSDSTDSLPSLMSSFQDVGELELAMEDFFD